MSSLSSYPTKAFKETQKFLVRDPATGSPSFVLGSDLVSYITPKLNYVRSETTRLAAENADYKVGNVVQTTGATSVGDGQAALYLVVASGEGDFPMLNGNELLVIAGDEFLREQLASNATGDGTDLITYTGTADTVTQTFKKRVTSLSDITALSSLNTAALVDGQQFYLLSYHVGLNIGGGPIYWDASRSKNDHDGAEVFSPTVPFGSDAERWDGTQLVSPTNPTLEDFLNGVGETDPGGTGCFVRDIHEAITLSQCGARGQQGSITWGDAAPVEAALNRKNYSTVYVDIIRSHLERTVQINTQGVNIRGARTGFDTLKSISVMFNVDVPGVSAQLNFYNLFFRNFPEDGSSGAGCIGIRCIDSPLIDSTMDACWFAMGNNSTTCIEGRFFFFKVANTIMEIGHRGIVTSGGTESNGLHLTNMAFFKLLDCALDFSDGTQNKKNFVVSNVVCDLGGDNSQGEFIRQNNADVTLSNAQVYIPGSKDFTNVAPFDIKAGSKLVANNLNLQNDLGERHTNSTHVGWFDIDNSELLLSNSEVGSPHDWHLRVGNNCAVKVSNSLFYGSSNNTMDYLDNSSGSSVHFDSCEFARDQFRFFPATTGLSGHTLTLSECYFNDPAYGDGTGANLYTYFIAQPGVDTSVHNIRLRKNVAEVLYHFSSTVPITIKGYKLIGSALLYNTGNVDYDLFKIEGGEGVVPTSVTYGTSAPTTGSWSRGAIVYNINPSAGGNIGWACVASGTPGTWKTFGTIAA